MKRIDWYILRELGGPFIFGVTAFTSIMIGSNLLFKLARYMIEYDMPLQLVGKLFLLELPGLIVFTFPMATLLSALLSFGRLSGNSEIIAFKAGGISFARMVVPAIMVGLLASLLTIYVKQEIVPYSAFQNRKLTQEFLYGPKKTTTQTYLMISPLDSKTKWWDYSLKAQRFDGETQTLYGVYFEDFEGGSKNPVFIITAERAEWRQNQWVFFNGETTYIPPKEGPVIRGKYAEYEMKMINRTPRQISMSSKTEDEMSASELKELIMNYKKEGKKVNKLQVLYHQQFAVPFACLIFVLLGAPLGLQPNRSGSSIGLGLSIIFIFVYYVLLTVSAALGQAGVLTPWLSAWLPNIIFGSVGTGLIIRASI